MRIAICDDERAMLDLLQQKTRDLLAREDLNADVATFENGEALLREYGAETHPFDILLLDIRMDDVDGIEVARRIREVDESVLIVFITSSAEYVFRGYEVRAFRYLMKTELSYGFDRVLRETLRALESPAEHMFSFQFGSEKIRLPSRHILYFESSRRVIRIVLAGEEYKTYAKLDDIERELSGHEFIRCHQSFLVNARHIEKLETGALRLTNGTVLPVSKKYRRAVGDAYLWTMR